MTSIVQFVKTHTIGEIMSTAHHEDNQIKIIVNGRERSVHKGSITYENLVEIQFPGEPITGDLIYTITYSIPNGKDGTLTPGHHTKAHPNMIFHVEKSNRS